MKGKTKAQKGITLIALIITIVVLLILAAVAINAITEYNIIENANGARDMYGNQVGKENLALKDYNSEIDKYLGGLVGTIGTATVDTKVIINSTINGEEYSANNPIIPAGFKAINTETSKWDEGNLTDNVKNGLVISDGISEFVWIPVKEITEMAKVTSGVDANGRTNYEGVLYEFKTAGSTEMGNYGQSTMSFMEPANLTRYDEEYEEDHRDYAERFTIEDIKKNWDEEYYQESFNKMVESVAKYKGFYVGRYEMSLDANGKAQSKAGETSSTSVDSATKMWWGLYEKATTYSVSGVVSEMIWGCQYDAMMRWMQENDINVRTGSPIDTARGKAASKNKTRVTGSDDSNDILNNVYDLLGNSWEWTQEGNGTHTRVPRGTYYSSVSYYPCTRYLDVSPTVVADAYGSRLTLYIE